MTRRYLTSTVPSNSTPSSPRPMAWRRCYTRRQGGGWIKDHEVEVERRPDWPIEQPSWGRMMRSPSYRRSCFFLYGWGPCYWQLLTDRALALNPSLALAWLLSGWVRVWLGEFEEVVDRISRSLRLNPADLIVTVCTAPWPLRTSLLAAIPRLCLGRKCVREKPSYLLAACIAPLPRSGRSAGRRLKKP